MKENLQSIFMKENGTSSLITIYHTDKKNIINIYTEHNVRYSINSIIQNLKDFKIIYQKSIDGKMFTTFEKDNRRWFQKLFDEIIK